MNQRTCVILKPDAYQRKLMGKIISRIEDKGWNISNIRMMVLNENILKEHYALLADKPFFKDIVAFMTSGPVVVMIVEGEGVVEGMQTLIGSPKWYEALPGTIIGDYANNAMSNIIYGSDTAENAEIEIKRFFGA